MLQLPVFDFKHSWSAKMMQAFDHCCDHLLIKCEIQRVGEAKRCIQLIKQQLLKPAKKSIIQEKRSRQAAKNELDGARLDAYMPVQFAKGTVREAYFDLYSVWYATRHLKELPTIMRYAANVAMNWIIQIGGFRLCVS